MEPEIEELRRENRRLSEECARLRTQLADLAVWDPVTGLPTYRAFDQRLADELQRAARTRRPFALAFIDIDGFAALLERHGQSGADEAVRAVGAKLRAQARSADFLARSDRACFALILVEVERESLEAFVERALKAIGEIELSAGAPVSVSIGIAMSFPVDSAATLIERADGALYAARQSGQGSMMLR